MEQNSTFLKLNCWFYDEFHSLIWNSLNEIEYTFKEAEK